MASTVSMGDATKRPRYAMVVAAAPPLVDGIGDYTAYLSQNLADTADVSILGPTGVDLLPLPGVTIHPTFSPDNPRSIAAILPALQADPPDWVIVHYNPFAYGPRGWNPYLPQILKQVRKVLPQTRIAIMAHEIAMAPINVKATILHYLHKWQFGQIVKSADVLFASVSHWADALRQQYPGLLVEHLSAGANLPAVTLSREEARARLGIAPGTLAVGLFGQAHISRQFDWMARAMQAVSKVVPDTQLFYIGPHLETIREQMLSALAPATPEFVIGGGGPFPLEEVAQRFRALDMTLCPYTDGVSARRSAFLACISCGLATVGTDGQHTDEFLRTAKGTAFLLPPVTSEAEFIADVVRLAQDAALRHRIGEAGQEFYLKHFDWPVICRTLTDTLHKAEQKR